MLDVEVDHVAIGEQLHQGRHDEEEAELLVPEDLDEFLDDDVPDATPHGYSSQRSAVSFQHGDNKDRVQSNLIQAR